MTMVTAFVSFAAPAAQRTYKGVVVDETGEPLMGAIVQVKGTSNGVSCDLDGNFEISAQPGQDLEVSYVGFNRQTLKLGNDTQLKVVMKENTETLEDVVVIGYGTMKKKDLTGSVTQIDPSKLADTNPGNVQDLLRGTAGLQIGYDASAKGGGSIELRGKNSVGTNSDPLIILDGMVFYGELSEINPDDIKQIDVLKDSSSAAIYGAKAANGVIIVTTKGGRVGAPTVTLSANWGLNTKTGSRDYYDPDGYIRYRTDFYEKDTYGWDEDGNYRAYVIGNKNQGYFRDPSGLSGEDLETWRGYTANPDGATDLEIFGRRLNLHDSEAVLENFINGRTFNWNDYIWRNGFNQDYNVSLSGGTDHVNYYMSVGYLKNQGVVKGDDYSTLRASLRLNGKVTSWLEVGGQVNFQNRSDDSNGMPSSGNYWDPNMRRFSPIRSSATRRPTNSSSTRWV